MKRSVIILGGGLAGIAAATALSDKGYDLTLIERRNVLGGRAAAFPTQGEWLDNCQHVILGCCSSLLLLLEQINASEKIKFFDSIPFFSRQQISHLRISKLPPPAHFLPSFLRATFLSTYEKFKVFQLFAKLMLKTNVQNLDKMTMLEWLKQNGQSDHLIRGFWSVILISSINETLERMSAKYGVMVLQKAFLGDQAAGRVGTPQVSLTELYHDAASFLFNKKQVKVLKGTAQKLIFEDETPKVVLEDGQLLEADELVSAIPFYNLLPILPEELNANPFFVRFKNLETSPIIGIHLWLDRSITEYSFGALTDSPIHWFFKRTWANASPNEHYTQLVISACRDLISYSNEQLQDLALTELKKHFPKALEAQLLRCTVVRETRATFSATPESEAHRPPHVTPIPHFYLAGDWTDTGWPATMEGAVRSGFRCAELILSKERSLITISSNASRSQVVNKT